MNDVIFTLFCCSATFKTLYTIIMNTILNNTTHFTTAISTSYLYTGAIQLQLSFLIRIYDRMSWLEVCAEHLERIRRWVRSH
jgi:ABC-type spermidine/putrescine transport system permease subunit II